MGNKVKVDGEGKKFCCISTSNGVHQFYFKQAEQENGEQSRLFGPPPHFTFFQNSFGNQN